MAGEEHGTPTLYEWALGLAVGVIGYLTRWVFMDTRKRIDQVDGASMERDKALRSDLDTHLRVADEGFQRLASIEATVKEISTERRESALRIEAALARNESGLVRLHERIDKVLEDR